MEWITQYLRDVSISPNGRSPVEATLLSMYSVSNHAGHVIDLSRMQTRTRAGLGFNAGVKDYRLTYYMDDYKVSDTDLLAAFRVVPQPGVPPEEAGAAIAAESSTGTWTTVWTDGLTSLDRYKGR